jgi:hypothetical protein
MLEETLTKALGEYKDYSFRLFELDDHTLVLEHMPCGFRDKFSAVADKNQMDTIKKDCADHLKRCKLYREKV